MLNLPRPTSWYFETCRQIVWFRLTFDKLYVLYSDDARCDLATIWRAAFKRAIGASPYVDVTALLDETIQADDDEWRKLVDVIEASVNIQDAVDDYFLGDDVTTVVTAIEGGGYRGA